ncbi:MAG: hypothetical protein ACRD4X_03735 [Candidatus Acidiferrales bacterium]
MKGKSLWFAVCFIAVCALAVGWRTSARDQGSADGHGSPVHFHGVINDYPVSTNPTMGPWELRGPWSLELHPRSGTADFSAALTMEFSDSEVLAAGTGATTDARHQHTHQITMNGATAVENPPQSDCPSGITPFPTYTWQLEVTGMANVAGNGGFAFGSGISVPLQVCIGGGPNVQASNVTLVFTNLANGEPSLATYHFGAQAIHGVVRAAKPDDDDSRGSH